MSAFNRAGLGILLSVLIYTVVVGLGFSLPAIFVCGGVTTLGSILLIHEKKA